MSAPIVWLASYPKSGNTWLRVLLTNYLHDGDEPADINQLAGGPIASARVWFDEWAGVEATTLDPNLVDRLRPEVYRCLAREADDTLFMKVHDAWARVDTRQPMFPADVTGGVVYVIRNPLDLVASCAHHWGTTIQAAIDSLCDPPPASRSSGLADQLPQRLGSWTEHVRSWVDESGLPLRIVRYEDLLDGGVDVFGEVVKFCGLDYDRSRVEKAVARSSFAEVRRQEEANGFRERSAAAPAGFFRRGEAGSWRDELPADLAARVLTACGPIMARFGYGA